MSKAPEDHTLHTCNCCHKERPGCTWQEPGHYWLCLSCQTSIAMRVSEARAKKYKDRAIALDRRELVELKADGLLPVRTYIYLALRLDYPDGAPAEGLDIREFCNTWDVTQSELLSAVGSLSKKGIIELHTQKLEVTTHTRSQRMEALERSVRGQ